MKRCHSPSAAKRYNLGNLLGVTMRPFLSLLLFGWCLCAIPVAGALSKVPATAPEVASAAIDTKASERVDELERRNAVLEAKGQLAEQAYSQFELGMAGLGLLITLLVVGFGFITHRAAVAAARQELAEMRNKVQSLHDDAARAKEKAEEGALAAAEAASAARDAAVAAQSAAEGAKVHQLTAEEASEKVKEAAALAERLKPRLPAEGIVDLSAEERITVSDAAKEVDVKPESQWTSDEFRVKILQAYDQGQWEEMLRLARGMEFLHRGDPESASYALFQQAFALDEMGRGNVAADVYNELADRFSETDSGLVQSRVATALYNRAVCLSDLDQLEEAIAAYDDVRDRFSSRTDGKMRICVADSMYNKGTCYTKMGKHEDAASAYDAVVERFGECTDVELQETVAMALVNKGSDLATLGRRDEAIDAYESVESRFGQNEDPRLCKQLAMAMMGKAARLKEAERYDEAFAVWGEVVTRFGATGQEDIEEFVAGAWFEQARQHSQRGELASALEALEKSSKTKGGLDREQLDDDAFDTIRDTPEFKAFVKKQRA